MRLESSHLRSREYLAAYAPLSSWEAAAPPLTKGDSTNVLAQAALAIVLMVRGGMPDFSATARSCSSITARA
jgi:hypothetical protein